MPAAIRRTTRFKRDVKKAIKQDLDMAKLAALVQLIADGKMLTPNYRDHALKGEWKGQREAHIGPDWLLIYRREGEMLELVRTGSHSELFE